MQISLRDSEHMLSLLQTVCA